MMHSTELERTIVPRGYARVHTDALRPIGNACAIPGAVATRTFARRNGCCEIGGTQMRRRAFVTGGDS